MPRAVRARDGKGSDRGDCSGRKQSKQQRRQPEDPPASGGTAGASESEGESGSGDDEPISVSGPRDAAGRLHGRCTQVSCFLYSRLICGIARWIVLFSLAPPLYLSLYCYRFVSPGGYFSWHVIYPQAANFPYLTPI